MTYKKILLKDFSGVPVGSLTLGGNPPVCVLPANARCVVCLADGELLFPNERIFLIPADAKEFSLLGTAAGKDVFATTLKGEALRVAKWRLIAAAEAKKAPTPSLKETEEQIPVQPLKKPQDRPQEKENGSEPAFTVSELAPSAESELEKAERLIASGTPFPLFEKLMPASRWALVEEDDVSYLVGVKEEDGEKRVLYGVPGTQGFPPDEEELWSFFPLDEEGEAGYFLTEAKNVEI